MIDVGLMIEGQLGVNWPRWQRLARVAEERRLRWALPIGSFH